ncbi:MAG: fibrobacter succinogenes major paralogous domain-containing protein, partial [Bacteroidales bacterium]|nr:fibrobacter succinogenes major paralogous domain-containing protein [Bacteroidales bacterium]
AYALSENYLNFGETIALENEILNNPVEDVQAFPVSNITLSNATISARYNIGGKSEEMGVVLSTEPNPSLENYVRKGKLHRNVFNNFDLSYYKGDVYVHRFRGLEPSTTYYTKVYLILSGKLYYSTEISFTTSGSVINRGNGLTDIEGNHYETVQINNQEWMAENLRVSRFRNGDSILSGNNEADWANKTIPLYAVFDHNVLDGLNNEEEVKSAFGLLYNGYTIKNSRQLCPEGWRLTTKNDWEELINYSREHLGYYINEGNFYLSESYFLTSCRNPQTTSQGCQTNVAPFWRELNYPEEQYDIFGLGLEATGYRGRFGGYDSNLEYARFWLADPYDAVYHYTISINPNYRTFFREYLLGSGNSVRCIRDLSD